VLPLVKPPELMPTERSCCALSRPLIESQFDLHGLKYKRVLGSSLRGRLVGHAGAGQRLDGGRQIAGGLEKVRMAGELITRYDHHLLQLSHAHTASIL